MKLSQDIQQDIFEKEPEMAATRDGYGEGLKAAGEQNQNVVALSADLTGSTRTTAFAEAFPDRFIQIGIAEQNMASVASGLAAMGKVPFIASYAMFSPGRSWEQVRTTIAYNDVNVKIVGAHAGVSVGPDGATHQAIEDVALMRVIPNMTVVVPCDANEARKAVLYAAEYEGPMYIRLAREKTPIVTTPDAEFSFGKAKIFAEKDPAHEKSVGIVTTGILAHHALTAAKQLNESGVGATVLHMATIKPLDTDALELLAKEHDILVTVEEHQRAGGLGGAVAEYLSQHLPIKIVRLGVDDQFGQSGEPEELIAHYGMDAASIVEAVRSNV